MRAGTLYCWWDGWYNYPPRYKHKQHLPVYSPVSTVNITVETSWLSLTDLTLNGCWVQSDLYHEATVNHSMNNSIPSYCKQSLHLKSIRP